jgi:hypothetical protein
LLLTLCVVGVGATNVPALYDERSWWEKTFWSHYFDYARWGEYSQFAYTRGMVHLRIMCYTAISLPITLAVLVAGTLLFHRCPWVCAATTVSTCLGALSSVGRIDPNVSCLLLAVGERLVAALVLNTVGTAVMFVNVSIIAWVIMAVYWACSMAYFTAVLILYTTYSILVMLGPVVVIVVAAFFVLPAVMAEEVTRSVAVYAAPPPVLAGPWKWSDLVEGLSGLTPGGMWNRVYEAAFSWEALCLSLASLVLYVGMMLHQASIRRYKFRLLAQRIGARPRRLYRSVIHGFWDCIIRGDFTGAVNYVRDLVYLGYEAGDVRAAMVIYRVRQGGSYGELFNLVAMCPLLPFGITNNAEEILAWKFINGVFQTTRNPVLRAVREVDKDTLARSVIAAMWIPAIGEIVLRDFRKSNPPARQ